MNVAKSKLDNKLRTIGSWITLNHPSVVEIMAEAGFDWLCIDMEHSVTDYFEAQQLILAIQSKGLKAFVRVGENSSLIIKRVLDAGADGIIVPSVNSASEAQKAVNAVNYPPIGTRGIGLARAQKYGFGFEDYRDNKAKNIILIVQIEHVDGIKELDAILQVDGVDGSFIGPYDLSGSIGKPGQWNEPEVITLLESYEKTVKKYNKIVGFHVVPIDYNLIIEKYAKGYNFIAFSFDALFLGQIVSDQLKLLKTINSAS